MAISVKCEKLDCKYISEKGYCTCKSLELDNRFIPTKKGNLYLQECKNYECLESIEQVQKEIRNWFKDNGN